MEKAAFVNAVHNDITELQVEKVEAASSGHAAIVDITGVVHDIVSKEEKKGSPRRSPGRSNT